MGLEAHFDNDHTNGISLLCKPNKLNKNLEIGVKQWILFDMKYLSMVLLQGMIHIMGSIICVVGVKH